MQILEIYIRLEKTRGTNFRRFIRIYQIEFFRPISISSLITFSRIENGPDDSVFLVAINSTYLYIYIYIRVYYPELRIFKDNFVVSL